MADLLHIYATVSWRMTGVIVAWMLLRQILRGKIPARYLSCGWAVIIATLLLPWRWPTELSPFNWLPQLPAISSPAVEPQAGRDERELTHSVSAKNHDAPVSRSVPLPAAAKPDLPPESTQPVITSLDLTAALSGLWFGGFLLFTGIRLCRWIQSIRALADHDRQASEDLVGLVTDCARELGISSRVRVFETDLVTTPSVSGVRHPTLLFPKQFAHQMTRAELRLIALHELGHWSQRDLWMHELTYLVRALHWFNPLAWVAARAFRDDCEAACDEFVMCQLPAQEIPKYGATLLKVMGMVRGQNRYPVGLGIFEPKQQLKKRIQMIAHYQRPGAWRTLIGATSIITLLVICVTREQLHAQSALPAAFDGKITTVAPIGWTRNGQNAENYTVGIDGTQAHVRPISAYVQSNGPTKSRDFGGMMQMIDAAEYLGKRLRFSGWVKTRDADKGSQIWMRVDGPSRGQSLQFDNMDNRPHPLGTADWQFCEVVLDVPVDATAVAFGFFVKESGQAWLNDAKFEVVDLTVQTTNMYGGSQPSKKRPVAPANLGFDAVF